MKALTLGPNLQDVSDSKSPSDAFLDSAIYLVDSSSYIFRAYYGIQNPLTAPDGTPTHATFGFLQMLQSLFKEHRVKKCVLVWDQKGKGFRHEIFPEYKANRAVPPEDLSLQIENSQKFAQLLGLPQFGAPGYEADDVIATLIHKSPKENFVIVTGDKDLLQLVSPRVWCLDTLKNVWGGPDAAKDKFGVEPEKVVDVQSLSGDSVDHIPGAPGIGLKTAAQLIQEFGSLDAVLSESKKRWAMDEKSRPKEGILKGKKLESIACNEDKILLSKKLVRLSVEAPVDVGPNSYEIRPAEASELMGFSEKLGFQRAVQAIDRILHPNAESSTLHQFQSELVLKSASQESRSQFKTVESVAQLKNILQTAQRAEIFALDTETKGLMISEPQNLVGISFAFSESEAYYIPLRHELSAEKNLAIDECTEVLQRFFYTDNPLCKIVFQNAKFDLHVLAREKLRIPLHRIEDTMIASFVLNPSERHGMDELAIKYLDGYSTIKFDEVVPKGSNFSHVQIDRATEYAAEDAWVTLRLWKILRKRLEDEKLLPVYENLDRPLIGVLQRMEEYGVLLDVPYLRNLSKELAKELSEKEQGAVALLKESGVHVGPDFNLGSPKQIAKVLFEGLKLPIIKEGKTGPSTDVSVMEELALKHPFPKAVLEIRELSKLLSTYVDALPEMVESGTSRLHTDFSQTVAVTGRLASSRPNLQNIPIRTEKGKRIRNAFTVAPGKLLLGVDYSQIELRVLAHMSEDPELLRAFNENADIHKRTAALVFEKSEDSVNADERRMAKAINFGIIYGQTAFGLAGALGIDRKAAQKFIDGYFRTYPKIKGFMNGLIEGARQNGFVKTLTGRIRYLPDIHSKNPTLKGFAERTAINSPLQGTAADLMKAAMIRIEKESLSLFPDAAMILQVHDELLFEVSHESAEEFRDSIVSIMERRSLLSSFGCRDFLIPMKAEAALGKNWGEI